MNGNLTLFDTTPTQHTSADVEFFDAPMCCSSGLCGPTVDQTLLDVNEMVLELKAEGIRLERYQMSTHPGAFMSNQEVMRLVREREMAGLPITAVRERVIKTGAYPSSMKSMRRWRRSRYRDRVPVFLWQGRCWQDHDGLYDSSPRCR